MQYTFNTWWKNCDASELDIMHKDDKKLLYSMIFVTIFSIFLSTNILIVSLISTILWMILYKYM